MIDRHSASSGNQKIAAQVEELAEPIAAELGVDLYDVQCRLESHGFVVRIVIDRPDGVSIDDCASVSRQVGHILEVEDLIECPYHLEVSSPGLDRPLKRGKDFIRAVGKKAKVTTTEPCTHVGRIVQADAEKIVLDVDGGQVAIALANVKKARLVVEF